MPPKIIERTCTIEMGHRLPDHKGKCRNIHGHSWKITLAVSGFVRHELGHPEDGMIVDYDVIKAALKRIDELFDHTLTLCDHDPLVNSLIKESNAPGPQSFPWGLRYTTCYGVINVLVGWPPTSENLAYLWGELAKDILNFSSAKGSPVFEGISVKETENSEAFCAWE